MKNEIAKIVLIKMRHRNPVMEEQTVEEVPRWNTKSMLEGGEDDGFRFVLRGENPVWRCGRELVACDVDGREKKERKTKGKAKSHLSDLNALLI